MNTFIDSMVISMWLLGLIVIGHASKCDRPSIDIAMPEWAPRGPSVSRKRVGVASGDQRITALLSRRRGVRSNGCGRG
jgi:hypothetical protein